MTTSPIPTQGSHSLYYSSIKINWFAHFFSTGKILLSAIVMVFIFPTYALAAGMPTFDLEAYLNGLSQIQLLKDLQKFQRSAEDLRDQIMNKVQDMVGIDKTVQASQDAIIKTIDANTPAVTADIQKKIDEANHGVAGYKTPDEQAADLLNQKAEMMALNKQCSDQETAILKARAENAKNKSLFMSGNHTNLWYQENQGKIESFKAADEAYSADLERLRADCEKQAKLLDEKYRLSAQGTVLSYEQKLEKDTEDSYTAIQKNIEREKNHDK